MSFFSFSLSLLTIGAVTAPSAEAQGKKTAPAASSAPASTSGSQGGGTSSGGLKFSDVGIGAAFMSGNVVNSSTSLTGYFGMNQDCVIQPYLTIAGTSPFAFGFGGHYKHTVARHGDAGFHLGGGFGLGTAATGAANNTDFFVKFNALAGLNFRFRDFNNLVFAVDFGPTLGILDGDADLVLDVTSVSINYLF